MPGFTDYFWRLLPANPILLRVVAIAGKRKRDLIARCVYLGLLIGVCIIAIAGSGGDSNASLSLDALTATSERIFHDMSFLQLALVALLAPIFTAGAITQEKDSQTYDILLATPLTNGQIVLGSLLSRMFFIFALLVSGIPIFSITQIFGGVAIGDIVLAVLIAAATAMVTGALATAIATFKVGTRRTIFSFYMLVVIYLVGIYLLDQLAVFHVQLLDPATGQLSAEVSETSWLTGLHPFLALQTLFPGYRPPELARIPEAFRVWPVGWYLTSPATFFPAFMFTLSAVLVLPSIALLRRMAQSTTTLRSRLTQMLPAGMFQRKRKPRVVWSNPIAWREARTKASASRASVLRYGFITVGLIGALVILVLYNSDAQQPAQFITANSYNATTNTLTVRGDDTNAYQLLPGTTITLDGDPASVSNLNGRFAVDRLDVFLTPLGVQRVQSLTLSSIQGKLDRRTTYQFLLGVVLVEVAVILLIVTNAAASTVTREREDGTLDLLLSTPITSRYYIWGKLSGLVGFMLPLVAVPAVTALLFVAVDAYRWLLAGDAGVRWLVLPEAVIIIPVTLTIVVAFATIVGMQMSLRNRTTVRAVMSSIGIVVGLMALLGWCGSSVLDSGAGANMLGGAIASFSPLSLVMMQISPEQFGGQLFSTTGGLGNTPEERLTARVAVLCISLIAAGVYAAIIYAMYQSMVKNFDMTIRRQTR